MDSGYILLARSILDSDVFASQKLLKIWIWCLCKANFKDRSVPLKIGKGETIVNVKRGSFIFGRNKAEEELFIDGSTIYKSMQKLELMDMIKIQSNNQYSIVTICKYNEYQQNENYKVTSNEQPSNKQVTSNEQPSNKQVTSNEQPSNTTNTLPKVKKDKQIYKSFNHLSISVIDFDKLVESGYSKTQVDNVLESIENYAGNKKYKSLYLTAKKWLSKEPKEIKSVETIFIPNTEW